MARTVMHLSALTDKATIRDMIGLTFWKYIEETKDPVKLVSTTRQTGWSTLAPSFYFGIWFCSTFTHCTFDIGPDIELNCFF